MRDTIITHKGIRYTYCGNGPGATGTGGGWSMRPELLFKCIECGDFITGDPTIDESCNCGKLHKDTVMGRIGSRLGDNAIEVYKPLK